MQSQWRRLRATIGSWPARIQYRTFAAQRLTADETADALKRLGAASAAIPGSDLTWHKDPSGRDAIQKTYHFTDFRQAWSWMSKVADLAEEMQHHPEWFNVYNMVDVKLTTHDCKGLSSLDIAMATKMDEFADELMPTRKVTPVKRVSVLAKED